MKSIIAGIVVIIALAVLLSVTPAYAPCIEGPGINCNGYPPQTLTQIKSDMLNYAITDKPHITIGGTPHISVHLEVDDVSSNMMFEHDLNLSSYGNASYALDISSYKPGVYSAIATSLMSKVTTSFAVGLATTGPIVTLNVAKNTYVQGDFITIAGTVGPDDAVQLSLIDPNDNVVTSIQTVSNNVGQYSTSALKIPTNAISGTWKITADHNTSHTMLKILVQSSSSNDVMKNDIGIISPLKQFTSGIDAKEVQCDNGLSLVIKAEDNSPACVKPQTSQKLVERGWAKEILSSTSVTKTTQISDALQLLLSTNSTVVTQNQTLGIDILVNNTSQNVLVKDSQNNWPMNGLSMGPCQLDPVGIGIYEGNYTLENIASARLLQLYQNGTYNCPALTGVDSYVFEPSSDKAVLETANGNHTGEVRYHASFDGFYTVDGFVPPKVGVYTILADDQWGHTAIQHFVVTNSTKH